MCVWVYVRTQVPGVQKHLILPVAGVTGGLSWLIWFLGIKLGSSGRTVLTVESLSFQVEIKAGVP